MNIFKKTMALYLLFLSPLLAHADTAQVEQPVQNQISDQELQTSAKTTESWLLSLDHENYAQSWNTASFMLQQTMPENEWVTYLKAVRKPLGAVISRKVADQRTAINPPNVAPGNYVVMVYDTKFNGRDNARELVTLHQEQGIWKVMGYFVN